MKRKKKKGGGGGRKEGREERREEEEAEAKTSNILCRKSLIGRTEKLEAKLSSTLY